LRKQADQVEQPGAAAEVAAIATVPAKKAAKSTTAALPKVKKPRKPKLPPRQRARWGVFDGGMKQVAIFDYNQRAAADERLAHLLANKKGVHFLQIVKELIPAAAAVEAPALG